MKLLLVDDDINVFNLLNVYLRPDEELFHLSGLTGIEELIERENIKLILLDINLGNDNGLKYFSQNRELFKSQNIFVFFLSQNSDISSKLSAFEFGAQDYIIKPFEPLEIMARIRARVGRNVGELIFKIGDLTFDLNSASLYLAGNGQKTRIELSLTEFKLLQFLAKHEGQVFSRQQLLDQIWKNDEEIIDRTVDQHISKLRKKVKSATHHIHTAFSLGYSFQRLGPG